MKNRAINAVRTAAAMLVLAGAITMVTASPGRAQATRVDGRWDAWLGCWQPAAAPDGAKVPLMCVVPAAGPSAVDVVTVSNGKETAREHIVASGNQVPDTRDGCTGWRSATWSRDGERVYLHSNYTCDNGVHRSSTGLIAMSADGLWLDVQGVATGRNTGVRVLVYREATDPGPLPGDVASAIGDRAMAVSAARVADAAPLNTEAVIDASDHLDAPVTEAWLVNRGDAMPVDVKQLQTLAAAGVPGGVTDVMVALANPDKFSLRPSDGGTTANPATPAPTQRAAETNSLPVCPYSMYGWDAAGQCSYSSYYGLGAWGYSPYAYCSPYVTYSCDSMYGAYGYPYSGYGYGNGYGYGGYGGYYPGGQPVVVVVNTPSPANGNGSLVKGRGYVGGNGSGSGGAHPSSSQSGNPGSSGASQSAGSSSGGSSAGSSSPPRTAHRTGGGGG